jgi:hypothetical protein
MMSSNRTPRKAGHTSHLASLPMLHPRLGVAHDLDHRLRRVGRFERKRKFARHARAIDR